MRRVISIFLPQWPMDVRIRRLRRQGAWQPAKPFVIATLEGQQRTVVAVNTAARARRVTAGMALSQARAIVPDVEIAPARPQSDARALGHLAGWSLRYSPLVSPCPTDGLWIDATGVAHLFGGEETMMRKIIKQLRCNGFTVHGAMASTPGAAWAWARYGRERMVLAADEHRTVLDALPLPALRLDYDTVRTLNHVGVRTIGELRAIPRATLPVRFGTDVLRRLDQAMGYAPEAIEPILPPTARRRRIAFAEPIAAPEDLQRTASVLTEQLCLDLEKTGEGARKLDLVFERVDNTVQVIRIGTARPSRNAAHLAKLLGEKLGTVDPGFGIEAVSLTAWRVGALIPAQLETDGSAAQADQDMAELIDRLSNRIGAHNVFRVTLVASDLPERAAVPANPMTSVEGTWPANLPRPVRLLTPPEPVTVIALMPDHPPASFRWRGESHKVRTVDGPERLFGEWWVAPTEVQEVRDYFRVEDDKGERYWLFRHGRENAERWYMHGVFA